MKEKPETLLHYQTCVNKKNTDWVVFIHGLGGNHSIFYKQIDFFQKHYNLLLIDLPGHGKSPLLHDEQDLLSLTRDKIMKILDHLHIQTAHFVGISLGTIVLQQIGITYSNRVKSMILAGAVGTWQKWGEMLGRFTLSYPVRKILPFTLPYITFAYLLMPKNNHKKSRDIFIREAHKLDKLTYLNWSFIIRDSNLTYNQLTNSVNSIPKLYISGDEDHMFLKGILTHVEAEQGSTLHVIKKCGHVCNIEKSLEFNSISLNYLKHISEKSNTITA